MFATAEPGRRVVVLEAERIGHGASSRNGGFCDSSLTHGLHNGAPHWPDELDALVRIGNENHDELLAHPCGRRHRRRGRAPVSSPSPPTDGTSVTWRRAWSSTAGTVTTSISSTRPHACPTRLTDLSRGPAAPRRGRASSTPPAWHGAGRRGAQARRHTPRLLDRHRRRARPSPPGRAHSSRAGAHRPGHHGDQRLSRPVRRPRRYVVPVYDYVLVTEPLTSVQRSELGGSTATV